MPSSWLAQTPQRNEWVAASNITTLRHNCRVHKKPLLKNPSAKQKTANSLPTTARTSAASGGLVTESKRNQPQCDCADSRHCVRADGKNLPDLPDQLSAPRSKSFQQPLRLRANWCEFACIYPLSFAFRLAWVLFRGRCLGFCTLEASGLAAWNLATNPVRIGPINDSVGARFLVTFGFDDTSNSSVGPPSFCIGPSHHDFPINRKSDVRSPCDAEQSPRWQTSPGTARVRRARCLPMVHNRCIRSLPQERQHRYIQGRFSVQRFYVTFL